MPRRFRFAWVDVFARSPLEGNQLAVFPDARGLSDGEMQSIARETHLSETTFVFPTDPSSDRASGFRTRIFAVASEMQFAGHPTLGTAWVLSHALGISELSLILNVGKVPVRFFRKDGDEFGEMTQPNPKFGQTHDRRAVAGALGISPEELDPGFPIQTVSTGTPFAIVPVRTLQFLSSMNPSRLPIEQYLKSTDASFMYLISLETTDPHATLHARLFFSGGEDPATGSAAGPAFAWMVSHGIAKPGETLLIEQGLEINRRSHIYGSAEMRDGVPAEVRVGGHCAPVIEGELAL